ncbi:MAG: hypothetical protein LBJ17_00935 [Dysgonamonadaceae bacterium]|jgi:hypothetical protein|nr:hypothetical protein [Dysgonamonadaceae bacterium]
MKNLKLFLTLCICCTVIAGKAQNLFSKGDKVVGLGIGLFEYDRSGFPFAASAEFGLKDNLFDENSSLGAGILAGYSADRYEGKDYSYFLIGIRGAMHYKLVEKLDTYTGLMFAFEGGSNRNRGLIPGLFAGGRYYFTDNAAVFGEIGYGISLLQIGISIKL